jgi:hypothetical protein
MTRVNNLTDKGRRLARENVARKNTAKIIAAVAECRSAGMKVSTKRIADMAGMSIQSIQRSYYKLLE